MKYRLTYQVIYEALIPFHAKFWMAELAGTKDGTDQEVDQNLETEFSAEFPSEFPTTATMAMLIRAAGNAASASMD